MNPVEPKLKYNVLTAMAIITLAYFGPALTGNEEHYLALSKQYMSPQWMPESFSFNEFPGARLAYQLIAGTMLKFLSFEATAMIGKLLVISVSSALIGFLFYKFRFRAHIVAICLAIYINMQSFIGSHAMLTGFEAKHLAYIFNLLALIFIAERKPMKVALALLAATYFHFLVGAWAALYYFVLLAIERDWRNLLKSAFVYTLLCAPLILYFLSEIDPGGGVESYIYTHIRNPHHTLAFLTAKSFVKEHLTGIILSLAFGIHLIGRGGGGLASYAGIMFIGSFLFSVLAVFDKSGSVIKYLPFRVQTVAMFILLLSLAESFRYKLNHTSFQNLSLMVCVALIALPVTTNVFNQYRYVKETASDNLVNLMKQTPRGSVFIDLTGEGEGLESDGRLDLERRSERPMYVQFKFVPAGTGKIVEWASRLRQREEAKKDGYIPSGVDYAIRKRGPEYIIEPVKQKR